MMDREKIAMLILENRSFSGVRIEDFKKLGLPVWTEACHAADAILAAQGSPSVTDEMVNAGADAMIAADTPDGPAYVTLARACLVAALSTHTSDQPSLDTERLDWLDKINTETNWRNGTCYGWKFDINHNRSELSDHNLPALHVRAAIDAARGYTLAPADGR